MIKKLMLLLGIMAMIASAGAIIIFLVKPQENIKPVTESKRLKVVTTFYPMYLIGLNIADRLDGVEVKSLTKLNTGCLHDYQLTTEDMKLISDADVLVVNGGGMEGFLKDVEENYPKLTIIDASEGITMLNNNPHVWLDPQLYIRQIENVRDGLINYIKGESNGKADSNVKEDSYTATDSNITPDNNINADTVNVDRNINIDGNVNVDNNINIDGNVKTDNTDSNINVDGNVKTDNTDNTDNTDGIAKTDGNIKTDSNIKSDSINVINPDSAELVRMIEQNAQTYINKVTELDTALKESVSKETALYLTGNAPKAVIFHDSFAYLADRADIPVAFTVPLDSDTSLSADNIAEIIDNVRFDNVRYLFTEQQYSDSIAKQIEAETDARVFIIASVVTGNGDKNSYLDAMYNNIKILENALQ